MADDEEDLSSPEDAGDEEEDIDEFYDAVAGDYLAAYGEADGYFYDGDDCFDTRRDSIFGEAAVPDEFPPPLSVWGDDVGSSYHPEVTFDQGKAKAWYKAKEEVNFVRDTQDLGYKKEGMERLFEILGGDDSELRSTFKTKFGIRSLREYSLFMATVFLECEFSITYSKMVEHPLIDTTQYMDLDRYITIWKHLDDYHKIERFKNRAWEKIEAALNNVLKELFVPCKLEDEMEMMLTADDDKVWYNNTQATKDVPLEENSNLKRERHVKDNAPGVTADVTVYTASGFPVHVHFRRPGETEFHSLKAAVKHLFRWGEGSKPPNLCGKVKFAMDRGYWRRPSLYFLLKLGADIFGTIMRQAWYAFTFGKKKPSKAPTEDQPAFIEVNRPACMFQRSVNTNLGDGGTPDFTLTANAFRNGYSTAVAMTLASDMVDPDVPEVDFIISTSADAKRYNNPATGTGERFYSAFELLEGNGNLAARFCREVYKYVYPLTERQGDFGWRFMRGFSCVSSTMDKVIRAKAPYIQPDNDRYNDFKVILMLVGLPHLLPKDTNNNNPDLDDGDEANGSDVDEDESRTSEHTITDRMVTELLRDVDDDNTMSHFFDGTEE
jgi:hypothetical protein